MVLFVSGFNPKEKSMRKIWLLSLFPCFVLMFSCKKNDSCGFTDSSKVAPDNEKTALADSLEKYGIRNALQHPAGFYYVIENAGSGKIVSNLCSSITCEYWGGFFDGRGFDSTLTNPATFPLGQTIVGWQKGIPLIKEGGDITLYVPPSLGYVNVAKYDRQGQLLIPPNSYLVFKVSVSKIQE